MSHALPDDVRAKLRQSLTPSMLLRTAGAGVIALLSAPVLAVTVLLLLGLGGTLADLSPTGALVRGLSVELGLLGAGAFALLLGVLTVAALHTSAHDGEAPRILRATARAVRALPRLALALVVLVVALVVGLVAWLPITLGALVLAAVLVAGGRRRAAAGSPSDLRPTALRALVWSIPLLPVVAVLALCVAAVPASLSTPGSTVGLLRLAVARVRTEKRALLVLVVAVAPLTSAVTWSGITIAQRVQGNLDTVGAGATDTAVALGTVVLAAALTTVMATAGTLVAAIAPPSEALPHVGGPGPLRTRAVELTGQLRWRAPALGRTAMITTFALGASLLSTPATAVVALAAPTLYLSVEGSGPSPTLSAHVEVLGGDAPRQRHQVS